MWDSKEVMLLSNEVQDYLTSTVANHIQAWAYTLLAGAWPMLCSVGYADIRKQLASAAVSRH